MRVAVNDSYTKVGIRVMLPQVNWLDIDFGLSLSKMCATYRVRVLALARTCSGYDTWRIEFRVHGRGLTRVNHEKDLLVPVGGFLASAQPDTCCSETYRFCVCIC